MKSDIDFLKKTALSKYFKFDSENDTFLVKPSKSELGSSEKRHTPTEHYYSNSNGKFLIPLASALLKRIRIAELIIIEETITENEAVSNFFKKKNYTRVMASPDIYKSIKEIDINTQLADKIYADLIEFELEKIVSQVAFFEIIVSFENKIADTILTSILINEIDDQSADLSNFCYNLYIFPIISELIFDNLFVILNYKLTKIAKTEFKNEKRIFKKMEQKKSKEKKIQNKEMVETLCTNIIFECIKHDFNVKTMCEDILLDELNIFETKRENIHNSIANKFLKQIVDILIENEKIENLARECKKEVTYQESSVFGIISENLIDEVIRINCKQISKSYLKLIILKQLNYEIIECLVESFCSEISEDLFSFEIIKVNIQISNYFADEIISTIIPVYQISHVAKKVLMIEKQIHEISISLLE